MKIIGKILLGIVGVISDTFSEIVRTAEKRKLFPQAAAASI